MIRIRTRIRPLQVSWIAIFVCIFVTAISASSKTQSSQAQSTQNPPASQNQAAQTASTQNKIDGGVGACSASFTVLDGDKKPIYDAKISVELRYGFMNMRKNDLQIGTDSNGKAEVTGLPNFPKKPLEFHIKTGTVAKTVTDDPEAKCNASFDVVFAVR
ncbi:MAG TPA: hypothetical protein VGS59_15725 [Candidatus Acidoferrales bacterium]|nr:hypothetical protein [Candidatus Acidoferrales bacterium]